MVVCHLASRSRGGGRELTVIGPCHPSARGGTGSKVTAVLIKRGQDMLTDRLALPGCDTDPEHLARACWVLALLTEVFRRGLMVAALGPLGRFQDRRLSADELFALAPPTALGQLAAFRQVFQTALLPTLAGRCGPWALGPTFTGSALIRADADLIAAGLLLDLKTSSKLSLGITDLFQVIGYALLDFGDEYKFDELGIFSARYAYLATWRLSALLEELAGGQVSLQATRMEFRELLLACQGPPR